MYVCVKDIDSYSMERTLISKQKSHKVVLYHPQSELRFIVIIT